MVARSKGFMNALPMIMAALVLLLTIGLLKPSALGYGPGPPACGTNITSDLTLDGDMSCSGDGLIIGDNNVVLDCAGHSITGPDWGWGIYTRNRTGVTIRNCIVTNFQAGIFLSSGYNNTLINNTANDNTAWGIALFSSSNNNTLTNNTANNNRNGAYGIYINSGSYNTLLNNTASNNTDTGIFIQDPSHNNNLTDNIFCSNVRHDIHLYKDPDMGGSSYDNFGDNHCDNILNENSSNTVTCSLGGCPAPPPVNISDCDFLTQRRGTYILQNDLFPGPDPCFDIVTDYVTLDCEGHAITAGTNSIGIRVRNYNYTTIKNCVLTGFTGYAIDMNATSNSQVINNTGIRNFYDIRLRYSSNNIVRNNNLTGSTTITAWSGIYLERSPNNSILSNTVHNTRYGINFWLSPNSILTGNTANNNQDYSIYLSRSTNSTLIGNTANNGRCGIFLSSSNYSTLTSNTANNNSWIGIALWSHNNTLTNNTANNNRNGAIGIYINNANYNNLTGNTVDNNSWAGIYIQDPSHNNNLTDNIVCSNIQYDIGLFGEMSSPYDNSGDNYCNASKLRDDDSNSVTCSRSCPVPPSPPQNVTDCQVIDTSGTYILQNNITSASSDPCFTITANDVTLDCNGFSIAGGYTTSTGVFVSNSTDVTVKNCVLSQFAFGVFLGMSSGNNITNNTITNSFQGVYLNGLQDPDTGEVYTSDNNTIEGNRFDSNQESVFILFGNGNNITNNNITNAGSDPNVPLWLPPPDGYTEIDMSGSIAIMIPPFGPNLNSNNTISGNYVVNGLNDGLDLAGAINTTVIDNKFDNNGGFGIYIFPSCDSLTVVNNTANNDSNGISSQSSGVFTNNTANNNSQYGIMASGTLTNNTANNNGINGFSGSGDIENNTFCSNGERDISTNDSSIGENNTCDSLLYRVEDPATYTSLPCSAACPRTPITDCQAINRSGVHYLANSISGSGDCLDIQAGNVKLDCEGHSITGPGSVGNGIKTVFASRKRYVDITNCTITGWNNGIYDSNVVWYNILNSNISSNQYGVSISGFNFEIHVNNNSIYNNAYRNIQKGGTIFYNFSSNYFGTANCPDETKLSEMSYPYDINPYLDAPRGTEIVCDRSVKATVLFAPYYKSTAPYDAENTNFSITNTGDLNVTLLISAVSTNVSGSYPHNRYVNLRSGGTISILASDIDPNGTGYLMAVPLDTGGAFAYNYLTGKVQFNRTTGHNGTYYMLGFRAIGSTVGIINGYGGAKGKLQFDGTHLEQMPTRLTTPEYPPSSGNNSARFIVASPVNDLTRKGHDWDFIRSTTLQFLTFNSPYEQRLSTSRTLDTFWDTETCLIDTNQCSRSIFNFDVQGTPLLTFITTSTSLPVAGVMITYDNSTGFAETNTLYSYSSFAPIEIKYPLNATPTDPIPPITTATATNYIDGGYYTSVILNCIDSLSACEKINWQIVGHDTGTYSCTATPCVTTIDLPSGPSTLNFYSEDRAWNVETTKTQNFSANTITSDTILTNDLLNRSGYAIIIGADNIRLDCAGHSITGTGADVGILVSNHTNVTIKNCVVSNFPFGIFLGMSSNCNVVNNTVHDNWQGIYLAPLQDPDTFEVYTSDNNTIEGNRFDSDYEGISVRDGSYNNITSNSVINTGRNPDVPPLNNDPIDTDTGWQYAEIDTGAGISMMPQMALDYSNNTINNNRVINGVGDGLLVVSSPSNTFSNNVFVNNGNDGINLRFSSGDMLTDNAACHNSNQDIYLDGSSTGNTGDNTCAALQDDTGEGTVTCDTPCPVCGNDLAELYEVCDGTDLAGQTCQSLGYNLGGTLACGVSCVLFDESDCHNDATPPAITVIIPPSPANNSVQASKTLELHTNVTDSISDIDSCILELDGANETMNKIGTGTSVQCKATKTLLDRTTHNFTIYANDTVGNMARNGTWYFTIQLPRPSAPSGGEITPAQQILPPQAPLEYLPALILPGQTGEYAIPPSGAAMLLEGPALAGSEPPPAGSAYLVIEPGSPVIVKKLERITDPTALGPLPDRAVPLNSWDIEIEAKAAYFCRDYQDVSGIDPATTTVYVFGNKSWTSLPSDKITLNLQRKTICGKITSTPYLIAGFSTAISFPAPVPPQCPQCPDPGTYGPCVDISQSRLGYICNVATNYTCQQITESRFCIQPKEISVVQICALAIGLAIFVLVAWLKRPKMPVKPLRKVHRTRRKARSRKRK